MTRLPSSEWLKNGPEWLPRTIEAECHIKQLLRAMGVQMGIILFNATRAQGEEITADDINHYAAELLFEKILFLSTQIF